MKKPIGKLLLFRMILRIVGVILLLASSSSGVSWLMLLGLILFSISFVFSPAEQHGKIPSTKQFIAYSTLLTAGVIFMLIGISWLVFIGIAVALLSAFFSSQWPASSRIFLPLFISLGGAVMDFIWNMRDGHIFARTPPPLWFLALLIGALLCGVISEYGAWRKGGRSSIQAK
jgi:hypothetical protein